MVEVLNKPLKVGDMVIPMITHTGKLSENSLFGIVIGSNTVFMLDEGKQKYVEKYCNKCYKIDINDDFIREQYILLNNEYPKWFQRDIPVKAKNLFKGEVLYHTVKHGYRNLEYLQYLVYLGKLNISVKCKDYTGKVFSKSFVDSYCYIVFDSYYGDDIVKFEYDIKNKKDIDFINLVFKEYRGSNNYAFQNSIKIVNSPLKGLFHAGEFTINDINNGNYEYDCLHMSCSFKY